MKRVDRGLMVVLAGAVGGGACSLVNSADDPLTPSTSAHLGGSGGGTGGSVGGTGGAVGGTGGSAGGGASAECGNGEQEGDEACDDGGESASCDADCTLVECGDGTRNAPANEECDDGNLAGGDACDAQCRVTSFVIDADASQSGGLALYYLMPSVGLTELGGEEHFIAVWTNEVDGFNQMDVLARLYGSNGAAVGTSPTLLSSSGVAAGPRIASNAEGRSVVIWAELSGPIGYRVLEPGALPTSGTSASIATSDVAIGFPNVRAAHSGEFCLAWQQDDPVQDYQATYSLNSDGSDPNLGIRNLGPSTDPGSTTTALHGMNSITPVQVGFVVGWFDASSSAYTGQRISTAGAPQGATFAIAGLDGVLQAVNGLGSATNNAWLAGFVAEGTFGEATTALRPFMRAFAADGSPVGDAALISEEHRGQLGLRLVGNLDGPLLAIWYEEDSATNSAAIYGRKFSSVQVPEGPAFEVAPAVQDRHAWLPKAVVNSAGDVMVAYIDSDHSATPTVYAEIRGVIYPGLLAP